MENVREKRKLRGQKVWIEKDATWKGKKARWSLRQVIMRKEGKRKERVREYGKSMGVKEREYEL